MGCIRKGAAEAVFTYLKERGNQVSEKLSQEVDVISRSGGTPLVVIKDGRALGVIYLKDIVKGGIKERFAQLRHMGIKTIMITGDNRLTAATIAAEAGVDDFLAEAAYSSVPSSKVLGPYDGKLANEGEKLELAMPGDREYGGERYYIPRDEVKYDSVAPWPLSANGSGDSLHRIDDYQYANDYLNWTASGPGPNN